MINATWDKFLNEEFQKPYFKELSEFLKREYRTKTIYPPKKEVFSSFYFTDMDKVKVVILGQDPYHEPGQAQGLSFSVPYGMQEPPSLINILKELADDLGPEYAEFRKARVNEGLLVPWAESGVLLLNTVLTVRAHQAGSHRGKGWELFTDRIIGLLAAREKPMVFILWGAHAGAKKSLIMQAEGDRRRHLIIQAPHPSPLSAYRGFFGGRYFSRCNFFLEDSGEEPVDWHL